ncbi:MAG: glutamate mutase L [Candidatus Cloacimonetes bacterium]|nr:glutamate mutase L [Candidatus Cloacimonadota bacterium]
MKEKRCRSCGRPITDDRTYCQQCSDEMGYSRKKSEVIDTTSRQLMSNLLLSKDEAEKAARENIQNMPIGMKRGDLMIEKKHIVITDIGSTTTKALLLSKKEDKFEPVAVKHAPTTVEKPSEDVNIGILNAVSQLQEETGTKLLSPGATPDHLEFEEDTFYITTSSAGGGLQILVVGLTVFDSASSANRAALGAGGVILDTFAIDDKRTASEQMRSMNVLHPDMILFSGGVDGGAVSGLVRLGEILSLAKPRPKFGGKNRIPLIFAGNKDAEALIRNLFNNQFDLHIVPNLRPTMTDENLAPSRAKVHQLFMDNVMEQAPGYDKVKTMVKDDIIPTPLGVIKALQLLSESETDNVMAVDIGGATTDVFSNILGQYYRTVSANLGMSYSICNVIAQAGMEAVSRWLPSSLDLDTVRNYIGNKMLYPVTVPSTESQLAIEHAVAVEAIRQARLQHMQMNFNTEKIGFLDKLKTTNRDVWAETLYVEKINEERRFHDKDIHRLIGAGGVISKATPTQALRIIMDGLQPSGITEIYRDKDFISPHLGKLSDLDEELSKSLLHSVCLQKLGVVIRPEFKKVKQGQKMMTLRHAGEIRQFYAGDFVYYPESEQFSEKYQIILEKGFFLQTGEREESFETELPVVVDCRIKADADSVLNTLSLYDLTAQEANENQFSTENDKLFLKDGENVLNVSLPYPGEILVTEGQAVKPDTIVGENRYDPPRIFILNLLNKVGLEATPESLREFLLLKPGDQIKPAQKIYDNNANSLAEELQGKHHKFYSPVRGSVEEIDYDNGLIIMREIQDYSYKPVKVNIVAGLGVLPKAVRGYLKKNKGDFVYQGDILASKIMDTVGKVPPRFIHAPSTGTITEIEKATGILTIQYKKKAELRVAGIPGIVESIQPQYSAEIRFTGTELQGKIGFGKPVFGKLIVLKTPEELFNSNLSGKVVACLFSINFEIIQQMVSKGVVGIIASGINQAGIVAYLEQEIGVALTGNETLPAPIILTEGFGDTLMNNVYKEKLQQAENHLCYLDAHTQIRAGVTRPRILLVNDDGLS